LNANTLEAQGQETDVPSDCCPAVSPDGKTVVVFEDTSDGAGERWRLLDLATGKVLHEGDLAVRVYSAVVSPDGREVAVTGQTGEVVTIDLSDGDLKQGSTALGTEVLWLRYSDDGSRLVSSAADGAVSLWEASSLQLLGSIHPAHRGDPVAASADFVGGLDAVTIASFDGRIFRWNTSVEHTLEYACQMAGRNLSQDEWQNNYGDRPYQQTCPSH
jgi:WD40 repeat protein